MSLKQFEWYYFDVHGENGQDLVVIFHTKPFNSLFDNTIFDVYLYQDNQLQLHHFLVIPASQLIRNREPFEIISSDRCYIKTRGTELEVGASDAQISLIANFQPSFVDSKNSNYELLPQPANNKTFHWRVIAPYCEASVQIKWGNKRWKFKGLGYHDYNAGNINLKNELKEWYWGKFYINDKLYIFGEILDRHENRRTILVTVERGSVTVEDNISVTHNSEHILILSKDKRLKFFLSEEKIIDDVRFFISTLPVKLNWVGKLIEIIAHFPVQRPMLKKFQQLFTNTHYLRFRSNINSEKTKGFAFSEKMVF